MKGTTFQKPLELTLRTERENWRQGEPISGTLVIKNHGTSPATLSELDVHLAHGKLKEVWKKAPDALDLIVSANLAPPPPLAPGAEASFVWNFQTDPNCPITDHLSSPFLLYGLGKAPEKLAQLQLTILPSEVIEEFQKTFTVHFRFVAKSRKAGKNSVEIKFDPPTAKEFSLLEQLTASFRFEDESLVVKYAFQIRKIEATAATLATHKVKKEIEQTFTAAQYRVPSGRFDFELIEKSIGEALAALTS